MPAIAGVRPTRNGPILRHRSAPSKPALAESGQGARAANNIVRPQTKNRRAGIWEPNPLPRSVRAQEDGRIWQSLLPIGITAVDFPVIYGNIAALFAMSDADLRT